MEIYLQTGQLFTVPTAVADHLLKLATHDQLKILLYVLCHANEALSEEQIMKACKVPAAAIAEALSFWQEVNVLRCDAAAVTVSTAAQTAQNNPAPQPAPAEPAAAPKPAAKPQQTTSASVSMMPSELAAHIGGSDELRQMYAMIEQQNGNVLNYTEQKSLYWMHDHLGLPADVIIMLAAYCISIGSFCPAYMDQIAADWAASGITTHELAQEDIQQREHSRSFTGAVMRLFEMRRRPTSKQQGFIDRWQTLGFSIELIRYAYEKCRDSADDKLSFPFIDRILTRWHESGIKTVAEAELDDAAFREKKKQKKPAAENSAEAAKHSSIDMDDVARLINAF